MHTFLESVVFAAIVLAPIFASMGTRPLSANQLPTNINGPKKRALAQDFTLLGSAPSAE